MWVIGDSFSPTTANSVRGAFVVSVDQHNLDGRPVDPAAAEIMRGV